MRTPMRLRLIATRSGELERAARAHALPVIGPDDVADDERRLAGLAERAGNGIGLARSDDHNHADAAIEGAQHLGLGDAAGARQPAEHRRRRYGVEIEIRAEPFRQNARNVVRKAAAGDVGERLDGAGGAQRRQHRLDVDARRLEQRLAEAARGCKGRRVVPTQAGNP